MLSQNVRKTPNYRVMSKDAEVSPEGVCVRLLEHQKMKINCKTLKKNSLIYDKKTQ